MAVFVFAIVLAFALIVLSHAVDKSRECKQEIEAKSRIPYKVNRWGKLERGGVEVSPEDVRKL